MTSPLRGWFVKACSSLVSEKQMPTASMRSRICVGPGAGTGLARLWTVSPAATIWMACWVAGTATPAAVGSGTAVAPRRWGQLSMTWPPVTGSACPVSYCWATR